MLNIGDRIKEERLRLGHNQTDFAGLASVSKTTQFNYEKGERSPDSDYLLAVAAIGVDVLYVLTGERKPTFEGGITPVELAHIESLRELSEADRASVIRTAKALALLNNN